MIDKKALDWKDAFLQEQHFLSDYYKNEEGNYTLHLSLLENNEPMFSLIVTLPERQNCVYYANHWPARSPKVYAHFMALLGEGFTIGSKPKTDALSYPGSVITPFETGALFEGSWKESDAHFPQNTFTLSTLLPSIPMALHYGKKWEELQNTFVLFFHETMGK